MVTEDYVSFETAKLLKEKGFQAKCTACYRSDPSHTFELVSGRINYCSPRFSKYKMIPPYNAPTLQMAMKWLRETYKLHIWFGYNVNKGLPWYYEIHSMTDGKVKHIGDTWCGSYEVACETAIKYCLENLI